MQTKERWGWRKLVYNLEGKAVEEMLYDSKGEPIVEMEDLTEEEMIKEEEY